jgi:hypothetical protein
MQIRFINLVVAFVIVASLGCETEIDLKVPDHEKTIVVNGLINPLEPVEIFVTQSLPLNNATRDINVFSDAVVELWEDNQMISVLQYKSETFSFKNEDVFPKAGSEYKVIVRTHNNDPVIIKTTIPEPVPFTFKGAWTKREAGYVDKFETIFEIVVQDPEKSKNYYIIQVMADGDSPTFLNSSTFRNNTVFTFHEFMGVNFDEGGFNGGHIPVRCSFFWSKREYEETQTAKIILYSVSEELYKYIVSYELYYGEKEEPYSEPVPIYNSAINGIGILGGYSYTSYSLKLY